LVAFGKVRLGASLHLAKISLHFPKLLCSSASIGTVVVAALAASAEGVLQTITATGRRIRSVTNAISRSRSLSAEWYSVVTFWLSNIALGFVATGAGDRAVGELDPTAQLCAAARLADA
jgi:hypothetical protein